MQRLHFLEDGFAHAGGGDDGGAFRLQVGGAQAFRQNSGDGLIELAITGSVGAHSTLLHIFRWNGNGYSLLDQFFGDSGVTLRDVDGDGVEEVIVGQRHYDRGCALGIPSACGKIDDLVPR